MAGAIRTGVQNAAYDKGWARAFKRKHDALDKADYDEWSELNKQFAEWAGHPPRAPEAEQAAPRPFLRPSAQVAYSCPVCGWHLSYSSEKCGNATCPRGKTRYATRS